VPQDEPVGRLLGLPAEDGGPGGPGGTSGMPLFEGDCYVLGRPGRRGAPEAVPGGTFLSLGARVRRSVPAAAVILTVGRSTALLAPGHGTVQVLVDGAALEPEGAVLPGPRHEVVVDPAGQPCRLTLRLGLRPAAAPAPLPSSGTTIRPVLRISGARLLPMAAALAWPLFQNLPGPLHTGWSPGEVASRYQELWQKEPLDARHTLHRLRRCLELAQTAEGRPMVTIPEVQPWPWAESRSGTPFPTEEAFTAAKNRITAAYLQAAGQVGPLLATALEQPRRTD
jgi:hypothetical protein